MPKTESIAKNRPLNRPPILCFLIFATFNLPYMLNLSFNLKDLQAGIDASLVKETPIICVIRYKAQRLKYYTGEKIHPKHWDSRKDSKTYQRVKRSLAEAPELNRRLEKILTTIKDVFRNYQNENDNAIPTPDTLKTLLDKEFARTTETAKTFMGFFQEVINLSKAGVRLHPKTGKPIAKNTIKTYVTTYKHLTAFQNSRKKPIDFDSIGLDFYNKYTEFLITGKELNPKTGKLETLNLSTNTIAKHFQIIKLIMNEANDRGLTTNRAHTSSRFAVIREKSDSIYLTEAEINELEQLDLSDNKKLERVRDLFLVGYYTGQRFSDYSVIDAGKITIDEDGDEFLEITQIKTGNTLQIPVHPNFKKIIEKHGGKLPRTYSNQKTNDYLKEIGKKLKCLQENVTVDLPTKGGMKVNITCPKYELITTHTARRSFATNHYLAGWQTLTIMNITGHKTERAFMSYIKLSSKEHAKVAHTAWKRRNTVLKAV
jgi:integrase